MKQKYTIDNPMPPLWMKYPHIFRGSIGWRMGYGESYSDKFGSWYQSLSDKEQIVYQELFPEPKMWRGYYKKDFSLSDLSDYFSNGVAFWNRNGIAQYSREQITGRKEQGENLEFVFFWKTGSEPYDCFGQWQPSDFHGGHLTYRCAEQYMMAEKARVFGDDGIHKQIMAAESPAAMKALGQKVKGFGQETWDRLKYAIVCNGNYLKFTQNEDMRETLLSTGDKILTEASPLDRIWGIGLAGEDERAGNPCLWRGQNLLGFALMETRDELRRVYQNYNMVNWREMDA